MYVTKRKLTALIDEMIEAAITPLQERIALLATQEQVDALTASVTQISTDLGKVSADLAASTAALQAEINKLATANPGVNVDALTAAIAPVDAAVQALDASVQGLGSLAPTPPPAG